MYTITIAPTNNQQSPALLPLTLCRIILYDHVSASHYLEGKLKANIAGDDAADSVESSVDKLTEPSSSEYGNGFSLAPTKWLIMLDIGREKGTWMPQSWGISGRWVPGATAVTTVSIVSVCKNIIGC